MMIVNTKAYNMQYLTTKQNIDLLCNLLINKKHKSKLNVITRSELDKLAKELDDRYADYLSLEPIKVQLQTIKEKIE
jgi:hypothetical protein